MRTKTFAEMVSGAAAAVQASGSTLVDVSQGSWALAIAEASSQVGLWLQGLLLRLLANSRASTATDVGLDSWMADFGVIRLPAQKAKGNATFARFTTTGSATVPLGATIQTADGSQVFEVTRDNTNPAWNVGANGYVMGSGTGSVIVPVQATVAGSGGNVRIGLANTIASSISGVDTVTNAARFTGGAEVESDAGLRARFILFINGRSGGTLAAVAEAVKSAASVASYSIVENKDFAGTTHVGNFYVVIDDGTGSPSNALVTVVTAAVEAVRPMNTTFTVNKATILTANVTFKVAAAAGFSIAKMQSKAAAAVTAYMTTLGLGEGLNLTKIAQLAYESSPGITNVFNIQINGSAADLAGNAKKVPRGTVTVTH